MDVTNHMDVSNAVPVETPEQNGHNPPTLRQVLAPLVDLPDPSFAARHLLSCLSFLEKAQSGLRERKGAQAETLADQDGILLCWLAGVYNGLSGSQAIIHGDLLQPEFTASGMLAPFVQAIPPQPQQQAQPDQEAAAGSDAATIQPSTGARFGVPSTTEVLCDNASELLRMAGAALIGLYVYTNFRQGPDDLPGDEVTLMFTTVAIHSCSDAANASAIDGQIQALVDADIKEHGEASVWWQRQQQQQQQQVVAGQAQDQQQQEPPFGCAQIRWLMHYVRGMVAHYMAAVSHVMEDKERQAECYYAQQKDMQYMCKALPQHPLGYSLFARCAMNGQQMGIAQAFLDKGLQVAKAVRADTAIAVMSFQRVAALLLGGAGGQLDAAEVQQLLQDGEAARESVFSWWPVPWTAAADDGEPDRGLVLHKLLPEYERRSGAALPVDGKVDAMTGLLYVTRPPAAIPAGAVQQIVAGGHEVVEEGDA